MTAKLQTYATPAEVRRMKRLRERVGITQQLAGAALYTPRRTYQTWEDGHARMHRVIWQAAMALLEAREAAANAAQQQTPAGENT